MSFCNSLRCRPSCSTLIPILLSTTNGLSLRENELKTHDLAIPIASESSNSNLRAIILTQSSVTPRNIDPTLSRLQHFESLTGGTDSAIIFTLFPTQAMKSAIADSIESQLFPSPLHAFSKAQLVLMDHSINIPILPLSTPASLPKIINTFISSLNSSLVLSADLKPINAAMNVLPYATGNGTMSQQVHIAMTDMFASMRDVAGMGVGEEAKGRLIQGGLNEDEAEDYMQFWVEEWTCD